MYRYIRVELVVPNHEQRLPRKNKNEELLMGCDHTIKFSDWKM